jgi:hypothetical protein
MKKNREVRITNEKRNEKRKKKIESLDVRKKNE